MREDDGQYNGSDQSFPALAGGARPPLRLLWQVPTFALGLIAFAAVCAVHPPWQASATAPDSSLAELRELLKHNDFDRDRGLVLGARAVHGATTPQAEAEAHFLLGSAYLVLAERAGPRKGNDEWREARKQLERARALGVEEPDRARLDFRLARVWAHTDEPPARVIAALAPSIEGGADNDLEVLEGYGLLADAYLKLPQRDVKAALAATEKQVGLPIVAAELLAPARLRRGQLLLELGRSEDGRDVLKNIGATAPPPILAAARRLRVQSLETDGLWAEAVPVWREIKEEKPGADRDAVLYHLGHCLRNSGDPAADEVFRVWEECLAHNCTGDEGRAAALGLGELRLRKGQVEAALTAFAQAVQDVKEPGDWHNTLVPLPKVREVFEAACKTARTARAFEASMQLARLYERLAPPGRAAELLAEGAEAGARAAQEEARQANGADANNFVLTAERLLRDAGEAYEQAAAAQADPAEQAERWWRAGTNDLEGRAEPQRTVAAFQRFLEIAERPDMMAAERFNARLNEGWYKLGLAGREAGWPKDNIAQVFAKAANSWKWSGRYLYRARYELAMLDHEKGSTTWGDDTKDQLEQNLHLLREAGADRDREAREKTLYALAFLYYDRRAQRGLISRAINTLEEALHEFPDNPDAVDARYKLAESYRLRADARNRSLLDAQPSVEATSDKQRKVMEDHEKAFAGYLELRRALESRPQRSNYEEGLLFYAMSMAAEMRFWAGDYEKSGEMFTALAERLRDRPGAEPERAAALANAARGYHILATSYPSTDNDGDARSRAANRKAQQALDDIRADLPKLDPKTRKGFEDFLRAFAAPMR